MEVVRRQVSELSQDPANARTHDEKNISAIIASLRRFGQQHPIVIDSSGVVRAGNGRLEAAVRLGWTEIDCVVTDLKGSDAIAYAIADNRTSELAGWDDDVLAAQLQGLVTDDEALLEAAGFSEDDLAALLGELEPEARLVEKKVLAPPAMSWVLVGIPTVRFAEIAEHVETIANMPEVILETTSNDG
jgi:ParB-like chromosome segregation protein Spo0J